MSSNEAKSTKRKRAQRPASTWDIEQMYNMFEVAFHQRELVLTLASPREAQAKLRDINRFRAAYRAERRPNADLLDLLKLTARGDTIRFTRRSDEFAPIFAQVPLGPTMAQRAQAAVVEPSAAPAPSEAPVPAPTLPTSEDIARLFAPEPDTEGTEEPQS